MKDRGRSSGCIHITGGRGRLARVVAAHFRSRGFGVKLYSRTPGDGFAALRSLLDDRVIRAGDTILHTAWSTLPVTSEESPGREYTEDLPLLRRLLEAAAQAEGSPRPHFVFFSSGGAVYGNASAAPSSETDICFPIGSYGRAKLAAEALIRGEDQRGQESSVVLRISNPYGHQGGASRPQGIVNRAIACAFSGDELVIWGDGTARKDYLYQCDFLEGLEQVVRLRLGGTYNLCRGESHSVNEVIARVEFFTRRRIYKKNIPAPAWDVQNSRLDGRRLQRAASWEPIVAFDDGVRHSVERFAASL